MIVIISEARLDSNAAFYKVLPGILREDCHRFDVKGKSIRHINE